MKNWIVTLLAAFPGALLIAAYSPNASADQLAFQNGALIAETTWIAGPQTPEESTMRISFRKGADGPAVAPPGLVTVSLFMPDMGHGSAPTRLDEELGADGRAITGVYRVTSMYFLMGGKWDVRITVKSNNGVEETKTIQVKIVESATAKLYTQVSADPFSTPAFRAICADGVTPHPRKSNFWHLDYPRFARAGKSLLATMHLRPNENGEYAVVLVDVSHPESWKEIVRFKEPIQDLDFNDGKVWVLFRNGFAAFAPESGEQLLSVTTTINVPTEHERAHAFVWIGNKLVIAHGTLGSVIYDGLTKRLEAFNGMELGANGQLSKTIDVAAASGKGVIFAVENVSVSNQPPFPFEGFIRMDVNSQSIGGRYPYDRKASGSLSNAVIKVIGDTVVINNWGILQYASLKGMQQTGKVTMSWKPIRFNHDGKSIPGELLGEPMIFNNTIIACGHFSYQDAQGKRILHEGAVFNRAL